MSNTMKAARIHQYGGAEVFRYEDTPRPELAAGEVLVKVHAAGLNPVDWKTRAGSGMSFMYTDPFPLILGWDISGVVEAVAEGVSQFKPGDEVFGMPRFPQVGSAYAEYVAVPADHLALKPSNVDHIQAAAIPLAALTVWQALFEAANLEKGQRLLIQGAAGGVGHIAVQIAKWKGAYVIGTGSTANIDYLRNIGVDEAVDYSTTRFEEVVEPVDMVLNIVSGEIIDRSIAVVKEGGTLVSIAGKPDVEKAAERGIKATQILVHTEGNQLAQIAELMASGHLKADVVQVFPLSEAGQAQELGESRALRRGKIVLQVQ
jgi:NADPH:quinone reductase-like Zn-dependent oxidoreductase